MKIPEIFPQDFMKPGYCAVRRALVRLHVSHAPGRRTAMTAPAGAAEAQPPADRVVSAASVPEEEAGGSVSVAISAVVFADAVTVSVPVSSPGVLPVQNRRLRM